LIALQTGPAAKFNDSSKPLNSGGYLPGKRDRHPLCQPYALRFQWNPTPTQKVITQRNFDNILMFDPFQDVRQEVFKLDSNGTSWLIWSVIVRFEIRDCFSANPEPKKRKNNPIKTVQAAV